MIQITDILMQGQNQFFIIIEGIYVLCGMN